MVDLLLRFLRDEGFSQEEAEKTRGRFLSYLMAGTHLRNVDAHFNAVEDYDRRQLIIVKGIDANLICPHHLLPVKMNIHIGYVPDGKILGLSKFARVARDLCGLKTQEAYTDQVAEIIYDNLGCEWVMVVATGEHACMQARGVRAHSSETETMAMRFGNVHDDDAKSYKEEFLGRIR